MPKMLEVWPSPETISHADRFAGLWSESPECHRPVTGVVNLTYVSPTPMEYAPLLMRLGAISEEIQELNSLVRRRATTPEISSLAVIDLELISPIKVVIRETEHGDFVATSFDTGIVASGQTEIEAFEMLRDMISSTFRLYAKNESTLGHRAQKQLAALRQFIRKA